MRLLLEYENQELVTVFRRIPAEDVEPGDEIGGSLAKEVVVKGCITTIEIEDRKIV